MNNSKHDEMMKSLAEMDVPAVDENAKKRAVNLAKAAYSEALSESSKKSEKTSQGFLGWLRPTSNSNITGRRDNMAFSKKKFIYGGMATACVAIVAVGLTDVARHSIMSADSAAAPSINQIDGLRVDVNGGPEETSFIDGLMASVDGGSVGTSTSQYSPAKAKADKAYEGRARKNERSQAEFKKMAQKPQATVMQESFGRDVIGSDMVASAPMIQGEVVDADLFAPDSYNEEGRDQFEDFKESPLKLVKTEPVSTFSVDVDTASYGFIRRQLNYGHLPQKDAVRLEEMVNYFNYDYALPKAKEVPFEPNIIVTPSPWAAGKKLVHIGIKGYDIAPEDKPRTNLVFLLDVSGSMNSPDKLPLVKQSMDMLLSTLNDDDTVAIVVYAGAAGAVLQPTEVRDTFKIKQAITRLSAGGGTAGGQGIELAYDLAEQNFDKDAVNRIILATDGDFNVGINNREHLKDYVERKRDKGIFLSVLGFGQGNYNDHMMQALAQNGNGVAAYIDSLAEAQKVLVKEANSTLFPIAKDVKIQVEFNPAMVSEYRLLGYETRALAQEDFNNDAVDAGDIGAGHTVTAIYEITPVGSKAKLIDDSRYAGKKGEAVDETIMQDVGTEYAFLKMRYKLPKEDVSKLISLPIDERYEIKVGTNPVGNLVREAAFATAVASFGQLLKGGKYTGTFSYDDVIKMAQGSKGADPYGYRSEFIQLVRKAKNAKGL